MYTKSKFSRRQDNFCGLNLTRSFAFIIMCCAYPLVEIESLLKIYCVVGGGEVFMRIYWDIEWKLVVLWWRLKFLSRFRKMDFLESYKSSHDFERIQIIENSLNFGLKDEIF